MVLTTGMLCLSQLLVCQHSVMGIIDEGSVVDIVYLDHQKAFDQVPNDKLMRKG